MFGFLIVVGSILGLVIALLGHPAVYAAVFRKPRRSADHSSREE